MVQKIVKDTVNNKWIEYTLLTFFYDDTQKYMRLKWKRETFELVNGTDKGELVSPSMTSPNPIEFTPEVNNRNLVNSTTGDIEARITKNGLVDAEYVSMPNWAYNEAVGELQEVDIEGAVLNSIGVAKEYDFYLSILEGTSAPLLEQSIEFLRQRGQV